MVRKFMYEMRLLKIDFREIRQACGVKRNELATGKRQGFYRPVE
jgi:hypothetical protein